MIDSSEAAFLQSIAEHHEDDTARLVFADWLEERGESPRSEFIRVQCKLASSSQSEEDHDHLRLRERELLNSYRRTWCQSIGVPVEDVSFERGLIDKLRLAQWDDGKLFEPAYAPQIATITELDLSGLRIGDAGVNKLAQHAHLPALKKLILSDNDITEAGTMALGTLAKGMPNLETLFLFQNPINDVSRRLLRRSAGFTLKNLDAGERAEGYCMSPGEAEVARRQYLRSQLLPLVASYFNSYELLQSAMLCVAQYWADEADDAVHGRLIVSELFEPTMVGVNWRDDENNEDPNIPNTPIKREYAEGNSSVFGLWGARWDDNSRAIPLWAAYAPEGGSQEFEFFHEAHAPAVIFHRHGGYHFLPMCRPHLDGVRPEWGWDDENQ